MDVSTEIAGHLRDLLQSIAVTSPGESESLQTRTTATTQLDDTMRGFHQRILYRVMGETDLDPHVRGSSSTSYLTDVLVVWELPHSVYIEHTELQDELSASCCSTASMRRVLVHSHNASADSESVAAPHRSYVMGIELQGVRATVVKGRAVSWEASLRIPFHVRYHAPSAPETTYEGRLATPAVYSVAFYDLIDQPATRCSVELIYDHDHLLQSGNANAHWSSRSPARAYIASNPTSLPSSVAFRVPVGDLGYANFVTTSTLLLYVCTSLVIGISLVVFRPRF